MNSGAVPQPCWLNPRGQTLTIPAWPLHLAEARSNFSIRTLVVDDSPLMLKLFAQILEETGHFNLVGTATDGRQALRQVLALSPELVLMDFHMPHFNGIQATRYLKESEHPPIVILVTSDDSAVAKSMAKEAGAEGFIVKDGKLRLRLMGALQKLFKFSPRAKRVQTHPTS